jgi:hypothetical protein
VDQGNIAPTAAQHYASQQRICVSSDPKEQDPMKRIGFLLTVSALITLSAVGAVAQSDSLGEYARAVRKEKRPMARKSYSNDNLPTSASISVVGAPQTPAEDEPSAKPQDSKGKQDSDKNAAQKEEKTAESKPPQDEQEWREQISGQKKQIADLEHELDLLQREYKLMVADYYADAGAQLRDQKKWGEEETRYHSDIAEKQKKIEDAKTQLQEMEEEARKAGMPSSVSE